MNLKTSTLFITILKRIALLFGFFLFIFTDNLSAQEFRNQNVIVPKGISLEYGIGSYAVTDEYISKEKYSGSLPYYKISWTKRHTNYIYILTMDFSYSSEIKNFNVGTEIYQFSLNQGFLYSLPEFNLFSKKAYPYIGPSTEMFVFANNQTIAVSGFDYAQSYAALISLGINSRFFYPLSNRFNLESSLNFSLLSLGMRMVDMEEEDEGPAKPLTLFSGIHASFSTGIRYYLLNNVSIKAAYRLDVTRISAWNPLHTASDNLIFTITYGF